MAFVNLSVLAGGVLLTVPILLHLLMRRRPRQVVFPAMRFLQQRQRANRRQVRLRHWLLLFLRCVVIGLLVAALARPSVASTVAADGTRAVVLAVLFPLALLAWMGAISGRRGRGLVVGLGGLTAALAAGAIWFGARAMAARPAQVLGDRQGPVAAVLVFDTSPTMAYRHRSQTSLEAAQEMAHWVVQQLPMESDVALIDSASPQAILAIDAASARNMIDSLETTFAPTPLADLLRSAVAHVHGRRDKRGEVYVFTDLSHSAWLDAGEVDLAGQLAERPDILLYVLDVGSERPRNLALDRLTLDTESLPTGRPLVIDAEIACVGQSFSGAWELHVEQPDATRPIVVDGQVLRPETAQRDRRLFTLEESASQKVRFSLPGLEPGIHHGFVRVTSDDGLPIDNQRFFSVEVHPPWPVLVAASEESMSDYLVNALSPLVLRQTGQAWFDCQVRSWEALPRQDLSGYAAVALLDPPPLTAGSWQRLRQFVSRGGGLAVFLGRRAQAGGQSVAAFNETADTVLPGRLQRRWRAAPDELLLLAPQDFSHPVLSAFGRRQSSVPWDNHPIFQHWVLSDVQPAANVVLRYSNSQPAIWESFIGDGRVLTMTTPVSDGRQDPDAWNWVPTGESPWPFLILANEMLQYLAGTGEQRLNYGTGQTATLLDRHPASRDQRCQLLTPRGDWHALRAEDGVLTVPFTGVPGTYHVKCSAETSRSRGFSVNLPEAATRLTRIESRTLDRCLGAQRYVLARSREQVDRGVVQARAGREFYPFLLTLLAAMLGLEQLVGNRFYADGDPPPPGPSRRKSDGSATMSTGGGSR
jgi:hypothetical protein